MKTAIRGLFLTLLLALGDFVARGELIVALTPGPTQSLFTFTSENPGEILSAVQITGVGAEQVLGIDTRPATGELYALTATKLYVINPTTGVATLHATLAAAGGDPFTALNGTRFGIDFNPVPGLLRVVSDAEQSLRINADTGAVMTDTPLAYAVGDVSENKNPQIVAAAYTNNDTNPGTLTTLFVLEQELYNTKAIGGLPNPALSLVRQGGPDGTPSPNGGVLTTIGAFGRDGVTIRGFDVGPSAKAFVAVELKNLSDAGAVPFFALVKVLLAPEGTDPAGKDESLGYIGNGELAIQDIAVISSVQFDTQLRGFREGSNPTVSLVVSRHGGSATTAMVDFSTQNGTAIAGQDYLTARGTLVFNVGEVIKLIDITIPNDTVPELDEEFHVSLSNPQSVTLGGAIDATVRISANDFTDVQGPKVVRYGLTGPSRGITGAVIEFDEDLDSAKAVDLNNYSFTLMGKGTTKVTPNSALYDPAQRTVTLGVNPPFIQSDLKKFTISINGKNIPANGAIPPKNGVTDVAGNLLDGDANGTAGGNAILMSKVFAGKMALTIKDRDGDKATITLGNNTGANPNGSLGLIDAQMPLGKKLPMDVQFWILDPIALRSTLSGVVQRSKTGDGIVVIAEIIGLDKKEFTPLLTNPSFRVNTLTFSSNATGR